MGRRITHYPFRDRARMGEQRWVQKKPSGPRAVYVRTVHPSDMSHAPTVANYSNFACFQRSGIFKLLHRNPVNIRDVRAPMPGLPRLSSAMWLNIVERWQRRRIDERQVVPTAALGVDLRGLLLPWLDGHGAS